MDSCTPGSLVSAKTFQYHCIGLRYNADTGCKYPQHKNDDYKQNNNSTHNLALLANFFYDQLHSADLFDLNHCTCWNFFPVICGPCSPLDVIDPHLPGLGQVVDRLYHYGSFSQKALCIGLFHALVHVADRQRSGKDQKHHGNSEK